MERFQHNTFARLVTSIFFDPAADGLLQVDDTPST